MRKGFSISFIAVVMLLISPLSLMACQWLEKTNSDTAAGTSLVAESGQSRDTARTDRLRDADISSGAILDLGLRDNIQNNTLNYNKK
jgi:hypothetical protein